jgi:tetratricopeptide (TPR) repeat protein
MIPHPCFAPRAGKALTALTVLAAFSALSALSALSSSAHAQSDAQKQEAKEHSDKARRLYDVGKYSEAIEEYQKVYLLTDDPNMLFNIGQCYRLTDRPEEAVRFYRSYLRRAPDARNRADVETKIAALEKTIEERRRTAPPSTTTAPPPTEPAPGATSPPTAVAPPPPEVVTPPPTTAQPPPVVTETVPPPSTGKRTSGYILLGTGAALIATAAISGAVAAKKAKDLGDLSKSGGVYDPKIQSSGKAANAVAVVTGLAGVAAAGVGALLLYTSHPAATAAAAASRKPPVAVAFFPLVGPQVAGGGAQVTF